MTNIRFVYMYRDASNYKQHGEVILPNETQRTVEDVDILGAVRNCAFIQQGFGGLKPCLSTLKSAEADWSQSALADLHVLSRGFIPAKRATENRSL